MDVWSNSSLSSAPLTRDSSQYSLHISDNASPLLDKALKNVDMVLTNQTKALSFLTSQFRTNTWAIAQLRTSLRYLNNSLKSGGKIVISGMGKSFKIASKTVATLNSLRMHSALLHPSEALHGDLGMIRDDHNDAVIIISASGNSPELLQMLEHIPLSVPIILMTCSRSSILAKHRKVVSLLYAEIPTNLSEKNLYGLSAPTISTTLCLTMLDAVSIALSELQINDTAMRKAIFGVYHPGGAIGINNQLEKMQIESRTEEESLTADNAVPMKASSMDDYNSTITGETLVTDSNGDDEKVENELNNSVSSGCLDIGELVLMKKIDDSKYKTTLSSLPELEQDLHKLVILNDYVVITSENEPKRVLDCETARQTMRESALRRDEWTLTLAAVQQACSVCPWL